ncbi:MAG: hypothetical protein U1D30_03155 [Planctomycetota bacterium]
MKRILFSWCAMCVCAASLQAGILPQLEENKWLGSFTGASDITTGVNSDGGSSGLSPGRLTATVQVDSPFDNQGTPGTPAPYVVPTTGPADHPIPTFSANGSEVIATVRDLQLYLAFDRSAGAWISGAANIAAYLATGPDFGDSLVFGDPGQLATGTNLARGGQFDLLLNTSGVEFRPSLMDPGTDYLYGAHGVKDSSSGAFAGGNSPSDTLLTGRFQNLFADGVKQTTNMAFGGTSLDDASIGTDGFGNLIASYALFILDIFSGSDPSNGDLLQTQVHNFAANVDITGGTESGSIEQEGLQVQNRNGAWTGATTDLRFSGSFEQIIYSGQLPENAGVLFDDLQAVGNTDGSLTFLSSEPTTNVPEPASVAVWSGLFVGMLLLSRWRRKRNDLLTSSGLSG